MIALLSLALSLPVHATPTEEAESCVQTASLAAYEDGWRARDRKTLTLAPGQRWQSAVTLLGGVEYQFQVCGDPDTTDVQLAVYDPWGNKVVEDGTRARDGNVRVSVQATGGFFVVVQAVPKAGFSSVVALATLYQ